MNLTKINIYTFMELYFILLKMFIKSVIVYIQPLSEKIQIVKKALLLYQVMILATIKVVSLAIYNCWCVWRSCKQEGMFWTKMLLSSWVADLAISSWSFSQCCQVPRFWQETVYFWQDTAPLIFIQDMLRKISFIQSIVFAK